MKKSLKAYDAHTAFKLFPLSLHKQAQQRSRDVRKKSDGAKGDAQT